MEAASWIPHMPGPSSAVLFNLIYPFSPHEIPKLFFKVQQSTSFSVPQPTSSMPRSRSNGHSPSKIPRSQSMNFQEATDTVTGCWMTAEISLSYDLDGTRAHLPTFTTFWDWEYRQFWVTPAQGQDLSLAMPWSIMYQYACSMKPPPQPSLPQSPEQSIICWSDSLMSFSCLMAYSPSTAATEENAQFAEHLPSCLTSLFTAFSVQFTSVGGLGESGMLPVHFNVMFRSGLGWAGIPQTGKQEY